MFTASMLVEVTGGGSLTGFYRNLVVPVTGETHSGPRVPGNAVQSFPITVYKLQGILTADYDFNVLWFEGGGIYGLPSPGHTLLARQGGPSGGFTEDLETDYVMCEEGAALIGIGHCM